MGITVGNTSITFNDATTQSTAAVPAATALNATGSAPLYACRAWVNFNGTGTVAIRASGNVSSITDNDVGDFTMNFITAMPDVKYSLSNSSYGLTYNAIFDAGTPLSTTSIRLATGINSSGVRSDSIQSHFAIFR